MLMRKAALVAILLVVSIPSFAATKLIPIAGRLPGAYYTIWMTDVSLTNNTAETLNVDLVFYPEDHVGRTRSFILGPHESRLLEDAVGPSKFPGDNPESWLGQIEIRSNGDVSASAHIYTRGESGGTYGSTYEAVDPSLLPAFGAISGLVHSDKYRTNIAITNPHDYMIRVTTVIYDDRGREQSGRTDQLPPRGTLQYTLTTYNFVAPGEHRASLLWHADGGASVVANIVDNISDDPTTSPSLPIDAQALSFPVVGKTGGSNGTTWSTSASVSNSAIASGVTVSYRDNASGQTFDRTERIAGTATLWIEDVNAFVGAPAGTGVLRIYGTRPLSATVRVFNTQPDGSTYGAAIPAQIVRTNSARLRIPGVRRDEDFRLNVAIANDDAIMAVGFVHLYDDAGVEVDSVYFAVEAGKAVQVPMTRETTTIHSGRVEVEVTNGASILALASNIDNRTGDTLQRAPQKNVTP
jgi:hypothetical protein